MQRLGIAAAVAALFAAAFLLYQDRRAPEVLRNDPVRPGGVPDATSPLDPSGSLHPGP